MRAMTCKFDPYTQVKTRLQALTAVGHNTEKVNVRIIGGTWSFYPKGYQSWFVRRLFQACNTDKARDNSLVELQRENERSKHRIVEISIETRQDYISLAEIRRLRMFGITKVELGVQSLDDEILKMNNRGNSTIATIQATKLLKENGFKVSYQMMLNLLGGNQESDKRIFNELFSEEQYKPDHLKIYPLALLKKTGLYKYYRSGQFKPYSETELVSLLSDIKEIVPSYCRIERVIRDIPAQYIVEGGAKISNLRQVVELKMKNEDKSCKCIRCREIKSGFTPQNKAALRRIDYQASGGTEVFLSFESADNNKIYSFLRLRINAKSAQVLSSLSNSALIREIHTYGPQVKIGQSDPGAAQHQGFGKALIHEAERIAKVEFGIPKIAVIAGVGVRPYFQNLGYELEQTYMTKQLS